MNTLQLKYSLLRNNRLNSSVVVALGLCVGAFLEFTFRGIAARLLGVQEFGQFAYMITMISMLGTISTLGVTSMLPRYIGIYKDIDDGIAGKIIILSILIGLLFSVFVSIILLFWNGEINSHLQPWAIGTALIMPLFLVSEIIYSCNRGFIRTVKAVTQREIIRRGIPIIIIIPGLFYEKFVGFTLFSVAIGIGLLLAILYGGTSLLSLNIKSKNKIEIKKIIKFTIPLAMSMVVIQINSRMDIVVAGHYLSKHELGLYSASLILPQIMLMMPSIFTFSLLPKLSSVYEKNDLESARRIIINKTEILSMLGIFIAGIFIIYGNNISQFMLGQEYNKNNLVVDKITIAYVIYVVFSIYSVALLSAGKSLSLFITDMITIAIGFATQSLLAKLYGLEGLALGVIIGFLCLTFMRAALIVKLNSISIFRFRRDFIIKVILLIFTLIILSQYMRDYDSLVRVILWWAVCTWTYLKLFKFS